jgi:hypothetical protein
MTGVAFRFGSALICRVVSVEDWHLDVHKDEIGSVRLGFRHAGPTIRGLQHLVTRSDEPEGMSSFGVVHGGSPAPETFHHELMPS